MASSKVMSSTSPANPDLPRHSSTTPTPFSNSSASNSLLTPPPHSAASSSPASAADSHLHLHHHHQPIFSTPHQNLLHHQHHHQSHHPDVVSPFGSMNMEDIFKNIYSEPPDPLAGAESSVEGSGKNVNKMVDEVWKEIVSGGGGGGAAGTTATKEPRITLEDFLTKAGAVSEEDFRGLPASTPVFDVEPPMMNAAAGVQFPAAAVPVVHMQNAPGSFVMEPQLGFGNAMVPAPAARGGNIRGGGSGGGSGRGKRRAPPVEEVALDKATQQKQRRMIKNRESAARSRERKQAYTVELESLVTQLEEENARLLREEAEQKKERLKQLMESLIPVAEKPRPPRVLRRVRSMSW